MDPGGHRYVLCSILWYDLIHRLMHLFFFLLFFIQDEHKLKKNTRQFFSAQVFKYALVEFFFYVEFLIFLSRLIYEKATMASSFGRISSGHTS